MLRATAVSKAHGGAVVLDGVSLSIGPGQRVGVVGRNGIGKSTLLRILAGLDAADTGTVERSPARTTVGYLPQELDARPGETLDGYLQRRTGVGPASDDLDREAARLADEPEAADAYSDALDRFLAVGGGDFDARVAAVLARVGVPAGHRELPMTALSGGQFARAALAAVLLSRFDVLLLDEPTNNLDWTGLEQLEEFVRSTPAAVVVVSHDRAFLDATVERILEIEEETHRGREFAGAWSDYVAARALARRQGYERHAEYVAQRDALATRARTQRVWSEAGKARIRRSGETDKFIRHFRSQRSEQQAAKARATERALARLTPVDKPWEGWELRMQLSAESRSGDVVARLTGATIALGEFRLGPIDLEIGWADRVAVVGPNGSGKTTLLRAIRGEVPLAAGERWLGPGVRLGGLDQLRRGLAPDAALLGSFTDATGLDATAARSLLAKFGLTAGDVERPAGRLSAGERTRAQLAAVVANRVNCLVLDEPTNHLDLEAIEQLEQALDGYDGTLLLVSHDRRFLDAVRVDRVVALDGAGAVEA